MQLGNRISAMFVPLAGRRARRDACGSTRCTPATADLKEREQAVGAAALLGLSEYAAPTLLGLAARAAHAQRFANLIVTNIPGPQVPLYCLGAQMLEVYPIVAAVAEPHPQRRGDVVLRRSSTSASSATAPPRRDLEIARRRHRGRVRRAARARASRAGSVLSGCGRA